VPLGLLGGAAGVALKENRFEAAIAIFEGAS